MSVAVRIRKGRSPPSSNGFHAAREHDEHPLDRVVGLRQRDTVSPKHAPYSRRVRLDRGAQASIVRRRELHAVGERRHHRKLMSRLRPVGPIGPLPTRTRCLWAPTTVKTIPPKATAEPAAMTSAPIGRDGLCIESLHGPGDTQSTPSGIDCEVANITMPIGMAVSPTAVRLIPVAKSAGLHMRLSS